MPEHIDQSILVVKTEIVYLYALLFEVLLFLPIMFMLYNASELKWIPITLIILGSAGLFLFCLFSYREFHFYKTKIIVKRYSKVLREVSFDEVIDVKYIYGKPLSLKFVMKNKKNLVIPLYSGRSSLVSQLKSNVTFFDQFDL